MLKVKPVGKERQLYLSECATLTNPTKKEVKSIKSATTFTNPAYERAKKYTHYTSYKIPQTLCFSSVGYFRGVPAIRFPIGLRFEVSEDRPIHKVIDYRVFEKPKHRPPEFKLTLREDQERALLQYVSINAWQEKQPCGLVQLPTGKGKTILSLAIVNEFKLKTLVIVHTNGLVKAWTDDIKKAFDGKVVPGLIKAKSKTVGDYITIATIQTLNNIPEDELETLFDTFGLIIQDECLVGDTLITMNDGSYKPIRDIKNGDKVAVGGTVSNVFSRKSEIYELVCRHSTIKGSPTHKTWCVKKKNDKHNYYSKEDLVQLPLKDITTDYLIPVRIEEPIKKANTLGSDLCAFIALIICSGHLDKKSNRVVINVSKNIDFYRSVFEDGCKCFGVNASTSYDCRGNLRMWANNVDIRYFLETTMSINKGKKNNVVSVPSWIFNASNTDVKSFIETCFNCSGDLQENKAIHFNCTSQSFSMGLVLLLKRFGVLSTIHCVNKRKGVKIQYRVTVGGNNFNKFMDTFNLLSYKMTDSRNTGKHTFNNRYAGNYFLSDVVSCKSLGYTEDVYDFTVSKDNHSFIANGILTHNCHHCPSTSYELVNRFRATYRLGLTATPERNDGLTFLMTLYFGGFCYEYNKELQKDQKKDKDILPFEVIHRAMKYSFTPMLRPVGQRGYKVLPFNYPVNKYGPEDIPIDSIPYRDRPKVKYNEVSDLVMLDENNIKQVLHDVYTEGVINNRSCVVFFTSRVHCEHYFQKFKEMVTHTTRYTSGNTKFSNIAQLYTGATKDDETCLKRAINREVIITFTTFGKSTEGTNIPCLEVAFLVTSINDGKNTEQAIGRIRRKCDTYHKLGRVRVYDYDYNKVYMLRSHYRTRLERYKTLKGRIIDV